MIAIFIYPKLSTPLPSCNQKLTTISKLYSHTSYDMSDHFEFPDYIFTDRLNSANCYTEARLHVLIFYALSRNFYFSAQCKYGSILGNKTLIYLVALLALNTRELTELHSASWYNLLPVITHTSVGLRSAYAHDLPPYLFSELRSLFASLDFWKPPPIITAARHITFFLYFWNNYQVKFTHIAVGSLMFVNHKK